MKRRIVRWCSSILFLTAIASLAQAADPTLKVGDQAPTLQTGKWVQGEPVKKFDKGKAYVVEFWATWCGPCRQSIPHLNEVANKYKDKGLVVIGQDCWENDESLIAPFIQSMGSKMTYRVAVDDKSKGGRGWMADTWMTAAGQNGIPTAFLVDKNGVIAWIGHPMSLEGKLIEEVLAGTFDLPKAAAAYAKWLQTEMPLRALRMEVNVAIQKQDWNTATAKLAEEEKLLPEDQRADLDFTRFSILVGKKDYPGADALAAKMIETHKKYPYLETQLDTRRLNMLISTKEYAAANKFAAQVSEAHKSNADLQNRLAWSLATEIDAAHRDLTLAKTIATRANDAAKGEDPKILDTLARILFMEGTKEKAIELQQKAVTLATGPERQELQKTLDGYRRGELPQAD